jgi:hypothetical protein
MYLPQFLSLAAKCQYTPQWYTYSEVNLVWNLKWIFYCIIKKHTFFRIIYILSIKIPLNMRGDKVAMKNTSIPDKKTGLDIFLLMLMVPRSTKPALCT